MKFAFTDEQEMIAETAKGFFAENATSERTRAAMVGDGIDRSLWRAFAQELGLAGVALPEANGGAGLGLVELAIVAEAAGGYVAALPLVAGSGLAAPAILAGGSDPQRQAWLPRIAAGEIVATLAGPDMLAPHGGVADLFVVDTGDAMLLVRRDHAATQVASLATMDATRPYARIAFDPTAAEPLAEPEAARAAAQRVAVLVVAADALGGAQACLDRTVTYAGERVQFGRTIGSFQAIKHRLADMMVAIEQARSAVYWAACAHDEGAVDADLAAHAAKAFASDTYARCAGDMIQLHGGIGFTWEHDAHLFFKRAQADRTLSGAPEWHREQVARLIGLDMDA